MFEPIKRKQKLHWVYITFEKNDYNIMLRGIQGRTNPKDID